MVGFWLLHESHMQVGVGKLVMRYALDSICVLRDWGRRECGLRVALCQDSNELLVVYSAHDLLLERRFN